MPAKRRLSDLRSKTSQNAERARRVERVRGIVVLHSEIIQHQSTLDKAVALEREAEKLSESIGAIAATDDAVMRIEEAVTELSAANAAMNAVAGFCFICYSGRCALRRPRGG